MSVKSSDPLQEHIDRTKVGEQEIRVDVQRLLQGLRAYHDLPARSTSLAQSILQLLGQAGFGPSAANRL